MRFSGFKGRLCVWPMDLLPCPTVLFVWWCLLDFGEARSSVEEVEQSKMKFGIGFQTLSALPKASIHPQFQGLAYNKRYT